MSEPFAPLLFNLNQIQILPEHILAGVDDINTDDFNRNPIGTGSFRLVEWVPDQFIRMERFDDHFRGPALADGMTVFFFADSNAGVAALEAGEIDMVFTPPENQARFEDNPDFTLHNYVYFTSITLAFNHKHPILSDFTVRKAIEMGIDKDSLTETVTRGRGIVSHNQFAEIGPLDRYNDYDNVPPSVFDPEAANAMLDEAGYTMGDDGIRVSPDGEPLSFTCITYSGFDEYVNAQVIIQEMLREIGIDVIPTVVEYTTLEGMWADPDDDPNNRALELEEWPHPFEFDPDLFNELHSSNLPPGDNYMWFENEEIDALIEQGRTETDPDARVEIYKQIDVLRSETLPAIPLYLAVDGWVTNKLVLGPDGNPITTPYFRRAVVTSGHTWYKES
jgi:peptide/nickel transport system substrate-binding protein